MQPAYLELLKGQTDSIITIAKDLSKIAPPSIIIDLTDGIQALEQSKSYFNQAKEVLIKEGTNNNG